MRILHYSLGFPPYRRGGMTKYCMDLITEQSKCGHNVALLWPGTILFENGSPGIFKHGKHKINEKISCDSFELINPLPVPLLDGIKHVEAFTQMKRTIQFEKFLQNNAFDVLHVHTLMGLPVEFIEKAKAYSIRVVFTSHDYFGCCPRGSLFCHGEVCKERKSCLMCPQCNSGALSINKIKILQSPIYRILKDTYYLQKFRSFHRLKMADNNFFEDNNHVCVNTDVQKYITLRSYYMKMVGLFDVIHFNSEITRKTYCEFIDLKDRYKVISISHGSIQDCRKKKRVHSPLAITYLGPCQDERKGFFLLKDALDEIYRQFEGKFILNVFGLCNAEAPYICKNKAYQYDELSLILAETDVVIVPSVWNETFGFTVLESLSYGVPVLVSDHVGAKDIVEQGLSGLIFPANVQGIKNAVCHVLREPRIVEKMNEYIVENVPIKTMPEHTLEVLECLYK